jgi:hypothetical protein
MDAIDLVLARHAAVHAAAAGELLKLPEAQVRGRPHPGVNTIAWLLWHTARIEDVGVNRFLTDGREVLDEGWGARLGVGRRDVGTGMTDADVDALSAGIDLEALRGYWDAVMARTQAAAEAVRGTDLDALVPAERVERVSFEEGAVAPGVEWLAEFWAGGRSRGWMLLQTALLHPYGHYFEGRVAAGLWGARSP